MCSSPRSSLPPSTWEKILSILRSEIRASHLLATQVFFSACKDLEWRVSEEFVRSDMQRIRAVLVAGREDDNWAISELERLRSNGLNNWEVVLPIRNPECIDLSSWADNSVDLHGCTLTTDPPESLVGQMKEESVRGVHSYLLREEQKAFVTTVVLALPKDSQHAARIGARQADFALSSLRTTLRETWNSKVEPPALEMTEQFVYVRPLDGEDEASQIWEMERLMPVEPIVFDESRLERAVGDEISFLIAQAKERYVKGQRLCHLSERILGAYFLTNEAGKERTLMNRFLRLVCALEHLTTYDNEGKARNTLWFSLRGMLLSLSRVKEVSILGKELEQRIPKLQTLFRDHEYYPPGITVVEILKGAYDARSALAHSWAPGVAGAWYVRIYVEFLYRVVMSAVRSLVDLSKKFEIETDNELSSVYAACFQTLLLLGSQDENVDTVEMAGLAFAYPTGILEMHSEKFDERKQRSILDAVKHILTSSGLCERTDEPGLRASVDGQILGQYLHRRFELQYRHN
jgi:hypothetical protein